MRAGKNIKALSNANNASKVIPMSRNGSDSTHTRGQRIRANKATGQHKTNRMHQPINSMSAFISGLPVSYGVMKNCT